MKHCLIILTLFFTNISYAQNPALLSIQGFGGEDYEYIFLQPYKTFDGGFITSIISASTTGNLNTACQLNITRSIFKKYNSSGTQLEWEKCYPSNSDSTYEYLFPRKDGTFILGGQSNFAPTYWKFIVRKEDAIGNILWTKSYGGSNGEILKSMIATEDGGYLMYGITNSSDGDVGMHYGSVFSDDLWLIKIDSNGVKQWGKVIGGSDDEYVSIYRNSLSPAPNNGCYIVGSTFSTDFDCTGLHHPAFSNHADAYVARLDSSGNILWHRCLGTPFDPNSSEGNAIYPDGKGGILVAANADTSGGDISHHIGSYDFWIIAIDSNGNKTWDNCYGTIDTYEYPYTICKSIDGSIWISGFSNKKGGEVDTSFGNGDAWIVHTDSLGDFLSSKVLGTTGWDEATTSYPLSGSDVLVGGFYSAAGAAGGEFPTNYYGLQDIFIAKLAPWTTGINDISTEDRFNIFPNPAKDLINIKSLTNDQDQYQIRIMDAFGRIIYSNESEINGIIQLSVDNYARGIYLLSITNQKGQVYFRKILLH